MIYMNYILMFQKNIKDCESKIYALLYYLSHEINWFQLEPLVFRDFRILISNIALQVAITPRQHLVNYFNSSNKSNAEAHKIAVRYKYSAISVLRSTDKLKFCLNISKIITSSILNEKYSNNLFQNTLYHIASLQKNIYNKSEKYFDEIEKNINSILEAETNFISIDQQLAIGKIYQNNKFTLRFLEFSKPFNDCEIIKKLKKGWEEMYTKTHPEPAENFKLLSLEKFNKVFEDYTLHGSNTRNLELLENRIDKLKPFWDSTKVIIDNKALFYLSSFQRINHSIYYNTQFSNYLSMDILSNRLDRFTELIYIISNNFTKYYYYKQEYISLYKFIDDALIKKELFNGKNSNSELLTLINSFPSNLFSSLDKVFNTNIFLKRSIDSKLNINIFYPESYLLGQLELLIGNIIKRLDGKDLKNVSIKFELLERTNEFIELQICYDSTSDRKLLEKSNGGNLSNWQKEIMYFDGDLKYTLPNDEDENFYLYLKFRIYEKI